MYVYTGARSTAENTVSVYMYVYTHKIYINVNMCRGEIDGRQYYELFADNFALLDAEGLFDPIILLPDAYMYIFMCLSVCLSVCLPVCLCAMIPFLRLSSSSVWRECQFRALTLMSTCGTFPVAYVLCTSR